MVVSSPDSGQGDLDLCYAGADVPGDEDCSSAKPGEAELAKARELLDVDRADLTALTGRQLRNWHFAMLSGGVAGRAARDLRDEDRVGSTVPIDEAASVLQRALGTRDKVMKRVATEIKRRLEIMYVGLPIGPIGFAGEKLGWFIVTIRGQQISGCISKLPDGDSVDRVISAEALKAVLLERAKRDADVHFEINLAWLAVMAALKTGDPGTAATLRREASSGRQRRSSRSFTPSDAANKFYE